MAQGYITQEKDYWIAPNAITITLNALGDANRIQGSVASGAVIMCLVKEVTEGDGLGYGADHNPKRWPLSISPTYFNSDTEKYVYVAIPRSTSIGTQAVVVFPSQKLDIYGRSIVPDGSPEGTEPEQIGSTDYFYVYLQAIIDVPTGAPLARHWKDNKQPAYGELDTAEGIENKINSGEWYEYNSALQLVTFLKEIVMGNNSKFRNLKALAAAIDQSLTLGTGDTQGTLTGVATDDNYSQVSEESDSHIVTPSYLDEFGNTRYLSKVHDDTAAGIITFLQGLKLGKINGKYGFGGDGASRLLSIIFDSIIKSNGQGVGPGMNDNGIYMDANDGTIAADGLIVRGWMMVRKLIYNYLEIMEQDYQFSGGCDIEDVVDNGDTTYTIKIHKEKEGEHKDIAPGDILFGKVDDNTGGVYEYYTSWMQVINVTHNDKMTPDTAKIRLFPDNLVPGAKNFPPKPMMTAARRGNVADGIDPDTGEYDENYKKSQLLRQSYWELSTTEHCITHYWHVDSPILRADNYATCYGILPSILDDAGVLPAYRDKTKPSLYVSSVYYEHQQRVKYPARIIKEDRGEWSQSPVAPWSGDYNQGTWNPDGTTTISDDTNTYEQHTKYGSEGTPVIVSSSTTEIDEPYHAGTFTRVTWLNNRLSSAYNGSTDAEMERTIISEKMDLEVSRVWNHGALWECLVDGTTQEPFFGCTDWQFISGGTFALGFYTDGDDPTPIMGLAVRPANVDETVKPYLLFGQEDVTDIVTAWLWERESNYTALDEAWKNSARTDPDDPTSPLKSVTRTLHITNDDLPTGWDTDNGKIAFKCTVTFPLGGEDAEIMNRISIV